MHETWYVADRAHFVSLS